MYNVIYIFLLFFLIFYNLKSCCEECNFDVEDKYTDTYYKKTNEFNDKKKSTEELEKPKFDNIEILTKDIILKELNINDELINKIKNIDTFEKKIDEIKRNLNDIFDISIIDCMPRCMIAHAENNCCLESYLNCLLSNPWFLKFFYLLNQCCRDNIKTDCQVTYKICILVDQAINHPNFEDTIDAQICCDISRQYFERIYRDENNCKVNNCEEDNCKKYKYGDFQWNDYIHKVFNVVFKELNTKKIFFIKTMPFSTNQDLNMFTDTNNMYNCLRYITSDKELKNYNIKGDLKFYYPFRCIVYGQVIYHLSSYKFILGSWYSYDSLEVKKPTKLTNEEFVDKVINKFKEREDKGDTLITVGLSNTTTYDHVDYYKKILEITDKQSIKQEIKNNSYASCLIWIIFKINESTINNNIS